MSDSTPETPPTAPQEGPAIGRDEWVARSGENIERLGLAGLVARFEELPALVRYGALLAPMVAWPFLTGSDYLTQVGIDTLLYVLLALGLNVAVGWAGLLDLGYVAFYRLRRLRLRPAGLGAVRPASGGAVGDSADRAAHHGRRVPPRAAVLARLRRLPRDRDALLPPDLPRPPEQRRPARLPLPRRDPDWAITNGPNGISTVDPLEFFGRRLTSLDAYYWLLVGAIALVLARALPRQPLPHRPRLAGAARGLPGRGADEHAGDEVEAARVRRRRRRGRSGGRDLRGAARGGLPGQLRPDAADHALRDGDPRRRRQPGGRRARRDRAQPLARAAARPRRRQHRSSSAHSSS